MMSRNSRNIVFWEVDAQRDFLLPGGALYVPGAERILPQLERLTGPARQDKILLLSSADAHNMEDKEFREWPPHCLKGRSGAEIVREGLAPRRLIVPNREDFVLPENLLDYQQITFEKNTLDVFDNPHTQELLRRLHPSASGEGQSAAEFVVFGVVTEYCVRCTVDGLLQRNCRVALVTDAIKSLDEAKGKQLLDDWCAKGVRFLTTDQVLSLSLRARSAN
jgi:nicotinamidase/pyrazinamidase